VVVITEVPGITPAVADFARRVVDDGFTVARPDLFGVRGEPTFEARERVLQLFRDRLRPTAV
jgi:dienelactone hydrolase